MASRIRVSAAVVPTVVCVRPRSATNTTKVPPRSGAERRLEHRDERRNITVPDSKGHIGDALLRAR